jgi:hypothetical protein
MSLPFVCTAPGESSTPSVEKGILDKVNNILCASCKLKRYQAKSSRLEQMPASVAPIVLKADKKLQEASKPMAFK